MYKSDKADWGAAVFGAAIGAKIDDTRVITSDEKCEFQKVVHILKSAPEWTPDFAYKLDW